jgi:hypothetical protein
MSDVRWSLAFVLAICGLVMLGVSTAMAADGAVPVFSDTGPDAAEYGAAQGYPVGGSPWLLPGAERRFALLGIRGQMIFVDPASKLVMVHTAVRRKPVDPAANAETIALWSAIVQQLGGQ